MPPYPKPIPRNCPVEFPQGAVPVPNCHGIANGFPKSVYYPTQGGEADWSALWAPVAIITLAVLAGLDLPGTVALGGAKLISNYAFQ